MVCCAVLCWSRHRVQGSKLPCVAIGIICYTAEMYICAVGVWCWALLAEVSYNQERGKSSAGLKVEFQESKLPGVVMATAAVAVRNLYICFLGRFTLWETLPAKHNEERAVTDAAWLP